MANLLVQFEDRLTAAGQKGLIPAEAGDTAALSAFDNYLNGVNAVTLPADGYMLVGAVKATATLTVSSTGSSNDEVCVIANVTFTAKTSGATGNQFNISTTPGVQAANMAAAFNASADLAGKVVATVNGAVVTLESVVPGVAGNALQISESLTNVALVAFANGANGNKILIAKG